MQIMSRQQSAMDLLISVHTPLTSLYLGHVCTLALWHMKAKLVAEHMVPLQISTLLLSLLI